ncbi:NAD(P)/FAD-dependent oxidoreductase [Symbiobacterium terraclitae]|uniref:NAD(P)/FAD-dependent oxidoreductase n=1 Tax=Symbiobacterium terraclitae TaxID=557451 RepID=UPI0035B51B2B
MTATGRWDVVVVGAGMAGLATALWARRLGLEPVVLERENRAGGQLNAIGGRVFDYPGLDLPNGDALTARLLRQAEEAGVALHLDRPVSAVSASDRTCETPAGPVAGRALVLATGLRARRLNVAGEEALHRGGWVRRPSHDLPWFRGRRVAVIGGGDRALENAGMLLPVADRVYLLTRGAVRARPDLAAPVLAHPKLVHRAGATVVRFRVGPGSVLVDVAEGGGQRELEVDAVCIYIGNAPNSELVAGQVELDAEGYIVTDRYGETSVPGVFAVGDVCTPPPYQSLATAGGQAMVVAKRIALSLS